MGRRLRIGIRNEPAGATLGGSDYVVGCIAAMLSYEHDVEIVSHTPVLTAQSLSELCEADLSRVSIRHVEPQESPFFPFQASWRQFREARNWYAELSAPYDLFINSTHGVPPFCQARYGILLLLFPLFDRFATWPWSVRADRSLRGRLRTWAYDREWDARFGSYQARLANSRYTQQWTKRLWGIDCDVLHPPVDIPADADRGREKRNTIVSVGRFSVSGVSKKQLEMMRAFAGLVPTLPDGWEYESAGVVGADPADQQYVQQVAAIADASGRARVLTNLTRDEVKSLYQTSKVFWHATGFGAEANRPDQEEHFGIVTVESMAAGCVPVVVNRGGQPEIVEHGVSGFLWNTLEELREYTVRLASDDELRVRMSAAARARAQVFARPAFLGRVERVVKELTS